MDHFKNEAVKEISSETEHEESELPETEENQNENDETIDSKDDTTVDKPEVNQDKHDQRLDQNLNQPISPIVFGRRFDPKVKSPTKKKTSSFSDNQSEGEPVDYEEDEESESGHPSIEDPSANLKKLQEEIDNLFAEDQVLEAENALSPLSLSLPVEEESKKSTPFPKIDQETDRKLVASSKDENLSALKSQKQIKRLLNDAK